MIFKPVLVKTICLLSLSLLLISCDSDKNQNDTTTNKPQKSPIESNMNDLRVMLETYGFDWYYESTSQSFKSRYPETVANLKIAAQRKDNEYWKSFTNPVTKNDKALMDYKAYQANDDAKGMVLYAPIKEQNNIVSYMIYATDNKGQLIKKNGFPLTLTNS